VGQDYLLVKHKTLQRPVAWTAVVADQQLFVIESAPTSFPLEVVYVHYGYFPGLAAPSTENLYFPLQAPCHQQALSS
jgi:hypothetical protein